jgi:hypothetical protein
LGCIRRASLQAERSVQPEPRAARVLKSKLVFRAPVNRGVRRDFNSHHEPKKGTTMDSMTFMDFMTFIICVVVGLIHGTLFVMMKAQRQHEQKVETLLTEIRDKVSQK